ncbi:hypothetical protein AGMMS49965_03970 [Bacteroidia bacterium]|nr:hypothetical protein AGMMS49965_03970 [Bacteroidia bacterium]
MKKILIFATVFCLSAFGSKALAINASFSVGNSSADHQCWSNITSQVVKTGYIELKPSVYNGTFSHYRVYLRNVNDLTTYLVSWTDITSTNQNSKKCGVTLTVAGTYRVCIVVYNSSGAEMINTTNDSSYNFTVVPSSSTFVSTGSSSGVTCGSVQLSGVCNVSGYGCRGVRYRVYGSSSAWTYVSGDSDIINLTGLSQNTTYEWAYWGDYSAGIETGEMKLFSTPSSTPPSTPGSISGATTVCAGDGRKNYFVVPVSGATSYDWTYPEGWSFDGFYHIDSQQYDVFLIPGSSAQSGYVTVKANDNCGSSSEQRVWVTVNSTPSMPGEISGATSISAGGGARTYSIEPVSGATSYTWTYPDGWWGSSTTTSISATPGANAQSGDISVTANNSCGSSAQQKVYVTVNTSVAPTSISGNSAIVSGESTTLSVVGGSLGTNANWVWYSGSCGDTWVGYGESITVSPTSETTYYVRAEGTYNITSCASQTVTVEETLDVSPTSYIFASSGETSTDITITSTQSWTIESSVSWLELSKTSGSGNGTFTMTASANTSLSQLSATVTITGVTSGTTATVSVTQDPASTYAIDASAGAGGSISPNGRESVTSGNSPTFTFTPSSDCYEINEVWVDGEDVGKRNSYTFPNVTANHTISVSFKQKSYSITATAGAGGSISPSGTASVLCGDDKSYTITPNSGYYISQVVIDGVDVGAINSHPFTNVKEGHTISASFAATSTAVQSVSINNASVAVNERITVPFTITPTNATNRDVTFRIISGGDKLQLVNSSTGEFKGLAEGTAFISVTTADGGKNADATITVTPACNDVSPLLTTEWNQNYPYWNACPIVGGSETLTGCVATAMAQIMYYWAQKGYINQLTPENLTIPSYTTTTGTLEITIPAITRTDTYDWANMKKTTAEYNGNIIYQNAVARLMYECGVSVKMDYSPSVSTANVGSTVGPMAALPAYFNYESQIDIITRDDDRWDSYNSGNWDNKLIGELEAGRPVFYSGRGSDGHAFVVDGYRCSDKKFHFNWGWGGTADGYFATSLLDPNSQNFTSLQMAIINIHPNLPGFSYPTSANGTSTFEVTANATTGGHIIPSGATYLYSGENQAVAFSANSGYEIDQVFVDGAPDAAAKANGYHIFREVTKNHAIVVTFKASPTGVEEVQAQEKISIFPNPAKDEIYIQSEQPIEKVKITDLAGRTVASANSNTISVSHLPKGIYLVIITTDSQSVVKKIIKE